MQVTNDQRCPCDGACHNGHTPICSEACRGQSVIHALPDVPASGDVDFVAARLMESAWGTRANLDMPEARTVARYLRSFGIGRAESEAKVAALREAAERALHYFTMSAGDYFANYGDNDEPVDALRAALATEGSEG